MGRGFSIGLMVFFGSASLLGVASAKPIRDDFSTQTPSSNWYVCHRPENTFEFGVKESDRTEMIATVAPPLDTVLALKEKHSGCLIGGEKYDDDKFERSEIWESNSVWEPMGTEIWYRFDMYVDKSVTPTTERFVIGQWKEHGSPKDSPIAAQRFTGGTFSVSIEQDNTSAAHADEDDLCRVFIASQSSGETPPWGHSSVDDAIRTKEFEAFRNVPRSFSHSLAIKPEVDTPLSSKDEGCAKDISVKTFGQLPDPFGNWTTMVYHIRLSADNLGLMAIWANGKKVAQASGRIGFKGPLNGATQYFKFGAYRNPAKFSTTTKLSRFVRSVDRADVDPDGTLTPN